MERRSSEPVATASARRLVRTFVSLVGAEGVSRAMLLVAALIAVRALAPAQFGEYTYAVALASVATIVADLGLFTLVTRDISADQRRAPALLGAYLKTQLLLAAGLVALGGGLAFVPGVRGPASTTAIVVAFAMLAVNGLSRPFEATLTGRGQAHLVTVARTARGVLLVAATALVAALEPEPELLLAAGAASEAAGVVTVGWLCLLRSTRMSWRGGREEIRRLVRLALPFAVLAAFSLLYLRADMLMLGQLASDGEVGNYGVSYRVIEAALIVPAYFGAAFLATIAETGPESERGRMQTSVAVRNILLLCVPLAFVLGMSADWLVRVAAGGDYDDAGELLVILSPVLGLAAAYAVLANLQVALDRIGTLVRINVAGLAVKLAVNAYAIPAHGARGAAASVVAAELVVVAAQWLAVRDRVERELVRTYLLRFAWAAAAMTAVGAASLAVVPWTAAAVAGLAAFGVAVVALHCISLTDIRIALASLRGTRPRSAPPSAPR